MPYVHGLCWIVIIAAWEEPGSSFCEIIRQVEEYGVRRGHSLLDSSIVGRQYFIGILLNCDSAHL